MARLPKWHAHALWFCYPGCAVENRRIARRAAGGLWGLRQGASPPGRAPTVLPAYVPALPARVDRMEAHGTRRRGKLHPGWTPPDFTVDENGKVVGYVNDRQPNNWGRWGDLDERGTVNFITPEIVRDAISLIQTGEVISCAIPLDATGPVHPTRTGITHFYSYTGTDFVPAP